MRVLLHVSYAHVALFKKVKQAGTILPGGGGGYFLYVFMHAHTPP